MARYRRRRLSGRDELAASATSLLIGAGAAVASYYLARLFLSREELPQPARDRAGARGRSVTAGDGPTRRKLGPPGDPGRSAAP